MRTAVALEDDAALKIAKLQQARDESFNETLTSSPGLLFIYATISDFEQHAAARI